MNCKNCQHPLEENAHFCDNCGAKVVKSRINFKDLVVLFITDIFGVDSRFFRTFKEMAIHPDKVLNEYLSGVRKRYVNPFGFFAVAVGLSLIVYNYFEDDFLKINGEMNKSQTDELRKTADINLKEYKHLSKKEYEKLKIEKQGAEFQLKFLDGIMKFMLNYYNIMMFIFLPFYAMLSKWTYPKPHNFGEHIIMNAYVLSFTVFVTLIFFGLALLIHPNIYNVSIPFTIVYYLFVFSKLYQKNLWQNILKFLKFVSGLIIIFIVLLLISGVIGFVLAKMGIIKA